MSPNARSAVPAAGRELGAHADDRRGLQAPQEDFAGVSISKIRYLEDQKLLSPRRTAGGYRLYSPLDVERLRTILRLQRDEFLPLRVIRQELDSSTSGAFSVANQARQLKRANLSEPGPRPPQRRRGHAATGAAGTRSRRSRTSA